MLDVTLLAKGIAYTAHQAVGQKRKYDGTDYIGHPIRVAENVAANGGTLAQIAAGYLHDVVEDTGITLEQLEHSLGIVGYPGHLMKPTLDTVYSLTDQFVEQKGLNRQWRHCGELVRLSRDKNQLFWLVKHCDLLDNLDSIEKFDKSYLPRFLTSAFLLVEMTPSFARESQAFLKLEKRMETYDRLFSVTTHVSMKHYRNVLRCISDFLPVGFNAQMLIKLKAQGIPDYVD